MANRVYYGEYSLEHWINLILNGNIVLPDYQRYFVWDENKVRKLIKTLKDGQFVPPVTIGAFDEGQGNKNLILDGQQRLTSIFLAYLGLYPDKAHYTRLVERFADENDDLEEEEASDLDNVFEWTFKKLVERGNSKDQIVANIIEGNYKPVNMDAGVDFLKATFLGFSYLVPDTHTTDQQKFYSSVFRHINIQGVSLLPQESREALYHLNKDLVQFFNPVFTHQIVVNNPGGQAKMDFVRYLSLLSQYKKDGSSARVARGFKPQMEKYYEDYIYSIVDTQSTSLFVTFTSIFPDGNYGPRLEQIKRTVVDLEIPGAFNSIIELDVYFFGIIFIMLFESQNISIARKGEMKIEIDAKIAAFRADRAHSKAPGALKHLKSRMDSSIEIYRRYTNEQAH